MRELIEIVGSLHWSKLKPTPLWDTIVEPGSKMAQLFDLAQGASATTDEEAAVAIYGSPTATAKVQRLKAKLKDRLLDVIFLLDFSDPSYTDRQKAQFECHKKWATASTLLGKNIRLAAVEVLENLYRQTQRFEFTDLNVQIAQALRQHYGLYAGDAKKYEYYRGQYREYQAVWQMENEAEEVYTHLISRSANSRAPQEELAAEAEAAFRQIAPYLEKSSSFKLHFNGRLLQMLVHSSRHDHRAIADLCEQAIAFFGAKPYESKAPMQAFYYQLLVCCIQLRDFGRGQAIFRQHQDLYEEGSFNWFKVQELYFLLSVHTQHYDDAYDTCQQVLQQAKFGQQPDFITEMWQIYEGYMLLLVQARRVDRVPTKKFRLAKFRCDTPVFSKDKRGMHIPMLVLEFMYLLVNAQYDPYIDRAEALNKYRTRYLNTGEHRRSNALFNILVKAADQGFHREAVIRHTERFVKELHATPMDLANQPHEIEIMPYEDIWALILDVLPRKRFG